MAVAMAIRLQKDRAALDGGGWVPDGQLDSKSKDEDTWKKQSEWDVSMRFPWQWMCRVKEALGWSGEASGALALPLCFCLTSRVGLWRAIERNWIVATITVVSEDSYTVGTE